MYKYISNITFEKIYFFIVFLFAAQSTNLTFISDPRLNPLGFLLLIIPTLFMYKKYRLSLLDTKLIRIYIIGFVWILLQYLYTEGDFTILMTTLFFFQFIVAFVVVRIYKSKLFLLFEETVVILTFLDFILWIIMQIVGANAMARIGFMQPASMISQASILIFNVPQIFEDEVVMGVVRNCGFCWEPGRFASFVIIAIYLNLIRNKRIKGNSNLYILILGLLTSLSTTGYSAFILIIINYFFLQKSKAQYRIATLIIGIPLIIWIMSLSFMSDKIERTTSTDNYLSENITSLEYFDNNDQQMVVQRFEGLYLDFLNFIHAPFLGCGNRIHSYVSMEISPYLATSNGLTSLLGTYGVIIGLMFLGIYLNSAKYVDCLYNQRYRILLFLYLSISISYSFNMIGLFIAIMWYGYFTNVNINKLQLS